MHNALLFGAGLAALIAGAELFVRGAAALAAALRVSPLVIGLTVVAFGTSAPELAITINASLAGSADLALGNVVGSNICNVLFILGLSALVAPLVVAARIVRLDVPFLIVASFAVLLLGLDRTISPLDGVGLFAALLVYTGWLIRQCRREARDVQQEYAQEYGGRPGLGLLVLRLILMVVGLALLVVGADWLVDASVAVARELGVSELVIGLTIVAVGTSLPEAATSVIASLKGERDIAVGNIIGSCLFNLLCVLGLGAALAPEGIPVPLDALAFDIPVMIAVAVACLPILGTGHRIARWEGLLFLVYFVAYLLGVFWIATSDPTPTMLVAAVLGYVVPLTILTFLVILGGHHWRNNRRARAEASG